MLVGITGSYGSGKTTVSKIFRELGAFYIDADKVYHALITPGKKLYKAIVTSFGSSIIGQNKKIDRKRLARIAFKDPAKLKKLNRLTHPEVIRAIKSIAANKRGLIVVEASLLIESGFYKDMDALIVVKVSKKIQIKRLALYRNADKIDALKRISLQMSLKKRLVFADFIIDNNGSLTKTKNQVMKTWEKLGV